MDINKSITLSVVLSQVAAMPGLRYRRAANGLEVVRFVPDLGGNFVWVFPMGGEFTMFPYASHSFHMTKNKVV